MSKFQPISFRECKNLSDSVCVVMLGIIFNNTEDEIKQVDEFFHDINLIPDTSHVTDLRTISGNVRGKEGRTDAVIMFDSCTPNPMARLRYGRDIKWVSDFVVNFKNDYKNK